MIYLIQPSIDANLVSRGKFGQHSCCSDNILQIIECQLDNSNTHFDLKSNSEMWRFTSRPITCQEDVSVVAPGRSWSLFGLVLVSDLRFLDFRICLGPRRLSRINKDCTPYSRSSDFTARVLESISITNLESSRPCNISVLYIDGDRLTHSRSSLDGDRLTHSRSSLPRSNYLEVTLTSNFASLSCLLWLTVAVLFSSTFTQTHWTTHQRSYIILIPLTMFN